VPLFDSTRVSKVMATFSQDQVRSIADALGDTDEGLTGGEIAQLLAQARMDDPCPSVTKRHRLFAAFAQSQNSKGDRRNILAFIRFAMKPSRYLRDPSRFEPLRARLNAALAFAGIACDADGELRKADPVATIPAAEKRARELRADLEVRRVHPDVLRFCRSELLVDNYFHAALEAAKSIASKLRDRTGVDEDGAPLVDRVLAGDRPLLAINSLTTKSERDEQRGFANLVKGVFGMFRNPVAHEPRIVWSMSREDAEHLLTLVSLIHRRLDGAKLRNAPDSGQ